MLRGNTLGCGSEISLWDAFFPIIDSQLNFTCVLLSNAWTQNGISKNLLCRGHTQWRWIRKKKICFQKLGRWWYIKSIPVKLEEVKKKKNNKAGQASFCVKFSHPLLLWSPGFVLFLSPWLSITACKTLALKDLKVHSKAMQLFWVIPSYLLT